MVTIQWFLSTGKQYDYFNFNGLEKRTFHSFKRNRLSSRRKRHKTEVTTENFNHTRSHLNHSLPVKKRSTYSEEVDVYHKDIIPHTEEFYGLEEVFERIKKEKIPQNLLKTLNTEEEYSKLQQLRDLYNVFHRDVIPRGGDGYALDEVFEIRKKNEIPPRATKIRKVQNGTLVKRELHDLYICECVGDYMGKHCECKYIISDEQQITVLELP